MDCFNLYKSCILCPRRCGVDRTAGSMGVCSQTAELRIGRAALHMWEEPCISGENGSGAVFFSGCSLKCEYCQNKKLSRGISGEAVTAERLCEIFIELSDKGAHNINLVTPEHFAPHIVYALEMAKSKGLNIPIICNCGGYTSLDTLKMLDGMIDIYLPDFKYISPSLAKQYSLAVDYPDIAMMAIEEMVRQQPVCVFENDLLKKGVIVRHLCLPSHTEESKHVLAYLYKKYGNNIYLSIMNQYTPPENKLKFNELNRRLKKSEYERVLDYCISIGIENAFIQEGGTAKQSFIPEFNGEGVTEK